MLRSILAQMEYSYSIRRYNVVERVPFHAHAYVPEVHPDTGMYFCECEDEGHVHTIFFPPTLNRKQVATAICLAGTEQEEKICGKMLHSRECFYRAMWWVRYSPLLLQEGLLLSYDLTFAGLARDVSPPGERHAGICRVPVN